MRKKDKHFILPIFLSLAVMILSSCLNKELDSVICNQLPDKVSYARDVTPIIRTTCALQSCHVSLFEQGDFTQYTVLKEKSDRQVLAFMIRAREMPPANSAGPTLLDDCQMETLLQWIEAGSPNN